MAAPLAILSAATLPAPAPETPLVAWLGFAILVLILLSLDLFLFHRKVHAPSFRESAGWVCFWVSLALIFNGLLWWWRGTNAGLEFLTGYIIEWSLSMDNVFVFAVIFRFFQVHLQYQYRVLFWGIVGAIAMRLTFILVGSELVERFDWILPAFGAFLIYTAIKLATQDDAEVDPDRNWLLRLARRYLPVARQNHGQQFFVREEGLFSFTPLFLVLLVIESTDVLFAVDSVPAIFGVTRDSFVIFTSNIFAILGLRALYFLLASVIEIFRYLVFGLSAVLAFVGLKMVGDYFLAGHGEHLLPSWVSLAIVATLIGSSIAASLLFQKPDANDPAEIPDGEPAEEVRAESMEPTH